MPTATATPNTERAVVARPRQELVVQEQAECLGKVKALNDTVLNLFQCANRYHCCRYVGHPRTYAKTSLRNGRPPVLPNGHRTIGKGETIWCVCNGLFVPASAGPGQSRAGRPRRAAAQKQTSTTFESAEGGGCFVCDDCKASRAWMDDAGHCRPCELERLELAEDVRDLAESQLLERAWIPGSLMQQRDAIMASDELLADGLRLGSKSVVGEDDEDEERPSAPPSGDARRKQLIASKNSDRAEFEKAHTEWLQLSNDVLDHERTAATLQKQLQERVGAGGSGAGSMVAEHLEVLLKEKQEAVKNARKHMTRARRSFEEAAARCYDADHLDSDGPGAFAKLSGEAKERVLAAFSQQDLERARGPGAPAAAPAGAAPAAAAAAPAAAAAAAPAAPAPAPAATAAPAPAPALAAPRPKHVKTTKAALSKAKNEWLVRRDRTIDKYRKTHLTKVRKDRAELQVLYRTRDFEYETYYNEVFKLVKEDLGAGEALRIQSAAIEAVKKKLGKKRKEPSFCSSLEFDSDAEDLDFTNERWDNANDPEPMLESEYIKQLGEAAVAAEAGAEAAEAAAAEA